MALIETPNIYDGQSLDVQLDCDPNRRGLSLDGAEALEIWYKKPGAAAPQKATATVLSGTIIHKKFTMTPSGDWVFMAWPTLAGETAPTPGKETVIKVLPVEQPV